MEKEIITNWYCSICHKDITHTEDIEDTEGYPEVEADTHFDISRIKKDLFIDDDEIQEDKENRNEKMLHYICESCFVKILNESKTLGSLFWVKSEDSFIY